jgi:hypothetical protein
MAQSGRLEKYVVDKYRKDLEKMGVAAHAYKNNEKDLLGSLDMLTKYNQFALRLNMMKKQPAQAQKTGQPVPQAV